MKIKEISPSAAELKTLHTLAATPQAKALETAIRQGNSTLVEELTSPNACLFETLTNLIATNEEEQQQIFKILPQALLSYTEELAHSKIP